MKKGGAQYVRLPTESYTGGYCESHGTNAAATLPSVCTVAVTATTKTKNISLLGELS